MGGIETTTLLLSNLVSNVPAVLLLMPGLALPDAADPGTHTWYLLAVVSTFNTLGRLSRGYAQA